MKDRRVPRWVKHSLALLVLALFLSYLWSVRLEFLQALRELRAAKVALVAGLLIMQWGLRAWRDQLLFAQSGYRLDFLSLIWLNNLQIALNYLPFKAGTVSSASLLLSRFGISVERFAGIAGRQFLFNVLASSVLAAGAVWFSAAGTAARTGFIFLALVGVAAGALGLLVWHRPILAFARLVPRAQAEAPEAKSSPIAHWQKACGVFVLTVLVCLASAVRVAVVFAVVSVHLSVADALVVSAALMLSPLVAITPGGIGVTEALVGITTMLVDQAGHLGVVASVLDRMLILTVSAGLAITLTPFAWTREIKR